MSVMFNWTWSSPPIFSGTGITDSVACSFVGTNFQNAVCSLRVDETRTSCRIAYYKDAAGIEFDHYESCGINDEDKDPDEFIRYQFQMGSLDSDTGAVPWAKSGSLTVTVREAVSVNNLYSTMFSIGYGHTVIEVEPSISVGVGIGGFSAGLGLSFGVGTESMFYKHL